MQQHRKVALVTGASSDIGAAVTKELLAAEYTVFAQINSNKQKLEPLEPNSLLQIIQQDLSDAKGASDLINAVLKQGQRLDVLVNTIGPLVHRSLDELTPEEWQQQIHLNLSLAFFLCHYGKAALIESKGDVINFTFAGVEYLKSRSDSTAYCAAKAGLVVLTKSLATVLAPHQVRVNAISPGLIETGSTMTVERIKMEEEIPFGRSGTPAEIAGVLMWILADSPKYVTGSIVPVAGAWEYL